MIREIEDRDVEAVVSLWHLCGLTRPWNDPVTDIAFARGSSAATVLVLEEGRRIGAAVMVGHDGHRGAVYYLATHPEYRGRGCGRAIMVAAEDWLRQRGVWKLNLLVRKRNDAVLGFYAALGYGDQDCHVLGRRLDGRADRSPVDPASSADDLSPQAELG
ncbi:MAG: GNAT family acetyltransferase [Pseudomonadota bacterium]